MKSKKFRLEKWAFREWLRSKDNRYIVGLSKIPGHCPLANFIQEKTGQGGVSVLYETYSVGIEVLAMPNWAKTFAKTVDASKGIVYASDAMLMLDSKGDKGNEGY